MHKEVNVPSYTLTCGIYVMSMWLTEGLLLALKVSYRVSFVCLFVCFPVTTSSLTSKQRRTASNFGGPVARFQTLRLSRCGSGLSGYFFTVLLAARCH